MAPELGRDAIWQLARHKEEIARHALPTQLGGQHVNGNRTLEQYLDLIAEGWTFRTTRLTDEYTLQDWREARPEVIPLVVINRGRLQFIRDPARIDGRPDTRIVSMIPPETVEKIRHEAELSHRAREIARVEARILRDAEAEAERTDDQAEAEQYVTWHAEEGDAAEIGQLEVGFAAHVRRAATPSRAACEQ